MSLTNFHYIINFTFYHYISLLCFFFFCWLEYPSLAGLAFGLRNHDPGASKPSKSPGDRTRPGPHQPSTRLDFLYPWGFEPVTFHKECLNKHPFTDCSTTLGLHIFIMLFKITIINYYFKTIFNCYFRIYLFSSHYIFI